MAQVAVDLAKERAEVGVISNLAVNPAQRRERFVSSIRRLMKRRVKQAIGRQLNAKRQESLEKTLIRGAERVWALGYHLDDVAKLDVLHVNALLDELEDEGYKSGTIAAYLSAFRQLGRWLGDTEMAHLKRAAPDVADPVCSPTARATVQSPDS